MNRSRQARVNNANSGAQRLRSLGGDLASALERVNIPSYVIDADGVIRWTNDAARRLIGDVVGRQFTSFVAPDHVRRAREIFARKIAGAAKVTDAELVLLDRNDERLAVEVTSVPLLRGGHVIGVFGQALHEVPAPPPRLPRLTPRQAEVLHLLEHGRSTRQIADELHISPETVRNHIRGLLRALGVHSRLEAVALARQQIV
jgi:PAS domain S-box-containing protein